MNTMESDTRVSQGPVATNERLRRLLRSGRRASGRMSQRSAAKLAGISAVYWQKIESGAQPDAPATTLAAMCLAAGISAARLRDEGYDRIAAAVDELASVRSAEVSPEDYLAATPGASQEEISALQAVWKALRAKRTTDPFTGELGDTRKTRRPLVRTDIANKTIPTGKV